MEARLEHVQQLHKQYATFYRLGGGLSIFFVGLFLGFIFFGDTTPIFSGGALDYFTNVFTEMLGVGFTIAVLNQLANQRAKQDKQNELLANMRSRVNDVAISAVEQLQRKEWFYLVQNEKGNLTDVNWKGVDLQRTILHNADLRLANLSEATLERIDLTEANLGGANLQGVNLYRSNLKQANLRLANLQRATLSYSILHDANLSQANLLGANLENVEFNDQTVLPDNQNWQLNTDMARYTNIDHPNFWQPMWAKLGYSNWAEWEMAGSPTR